jgi:hypothetical protein
MEQNEDTDLYIVSLGTGSARRNMTVGKKAAHAV